MFRISLWDPSHLDQLSIMPNITRKFLSSPLFLDSTNVFYKSPCCFSAQRRYHEDIALSNLGKNNFCLIELTTNLSSATQWQVLWGLILIVAFSTSELQSAAGQLAGLLTGQRKNSSQLSLEWYCTSHRVFS